MNLEISYDEMMKSIAKHLDELYYYALGHSEEFMDDENEEMDEHVTAINEMMIELFYSFKKGDGRGLSTRYRMQFDDFDEATLAGDEIIKYTDTYNDYDVVEFGDCVNHLKLRSKNLDENNPFALIQ